MELAAEMNEALDRAASKATAAKRKFVTNDDEIQQRRLHDSTTHLHVPRLRIACKQEGHLWMDSAMKEEPFHKD